MAVSGISHGYNTFGTVHNTSHYAMAYNNARNGNQFPGYYPTSNIGIIPPKGLKGSQYDDSINTIPDTDDPIIFTKDNGYDVGYNKGIFGKLFQQKSGQIKHSSTLFNNNAFKNVLVGMLMWHLVSGMGNKYTIYNYYNRPTTAVTEPHLTKNMIGSCDPYTSILCGPDIQPVCTKDDTIYCLAHTKHVFRCSQDIKHPNCVNTTVFCVYENDPLCQNSPNQQEATVTVPCMKNITLDIELTSINKNLTELENKNYNQYTYCVTLMAVADPKYKVVAEG